MIRKEFADKLIPRPPVRNPKPEQRQEKKPTEKPKGILEYTRR